MIGMRAHRMCRVVFDQDGIAVKVSRPALWKTLLDLLRKSIENGGAQFLA